MLGDPAHHHHPSQSHKMDASTNENTNSAIGSMGAVDFRGEDESLSTFGENEDESPDAKTPEIAMQNSVELTFASPLAMADASFWDPLTDLYKAVQALTTQDNSMRNQSASASEALAEKFYSQIDALVESKGNATQKKLWQTATPERRHTLISSFFLPPGLLAGK